MHVDANEIQRLMHGESDTPADRRARAHVDNCDACRARSVDAERDEDEILALLGELDQPARVVDIGEVRATATRRVVPLARIAALIVFSAGALAAAYMAPGSPLRRRTPATPSTLAAAAVQPSVAAPSEIGVSVDAGDALSVLFAATQNRGSAIVTIVDGSDVEIRTAEGAARFTLDNRRVLIDNTAAADFQIRIGRRAPSVDIRINGRLVLSKVGGRITTPAAPSGDGPLRISLRTP